MGDMADYYKEQDEFTQSMGEYEEAYGLAQSAGRPEPTTTVWVTREGAAVPVVDMSDLHLTNTIRMLRQKAVPSLLSELSAMSCYITNAPDGAAMACESEANRLTDMTDDEYLSATVPTYVAMLREAEKRGLRL